MADKRGRPVGDGKGNHGVKRGPNKVTKEAQKAIADIVDENIDNVRQKLDDLVDPKDWLAYFIKLMEFAIPKKAAVNVTASAKIKDFKSELDELAGD